MENTSNSSGSASTPDKKGWFARNRIWFIVIAFFAISNTGIYFYQRHKQQKQAAMFAEKIDEKAQLANDLVQLKNMQAVDLLTKTLTWGVRGELIRQNHEIVDRFLIELVQQTQADLIIVEDTNHLIILSTDKKYENQSVKEILPAVPVSIESRKILKSELDEVIAAAPIMGDERQIGAMFLVYKPDPATMKLLDDIGANPFAKAEEEK